MKVAFIVNLDIPDSDSLAGVAETITESLADEGLQVLSVKPWARPGMDMSEFESVGNSPMDTIATPEPSVPQVNSALTGDLATGFTL